MMFGEVLSFIFLTASPGCFKRQCCSYGRPESSRWSPLFAFFALINVSQTNACGLYTQSYKKVKNKDLNCFNSFFCFLCLCHVSYRHFWSVILRLTHRLKTGSFRNQFEPRLSRCSNTANLWYPKDSYLFSAELTMCLLNFYCQENAV